MRTRLLILLFLIGGAGCGGANGAPTRMTIGASGGTVAASGASVTIPPGALTSSISITATATSAAAPAGTKSVGIPYLFGPEGTQFALPATVTLTLPAGTVATDVTIYTAPAGSTSYAALSTTVTDATHVSATTTHFSIFVATVPIGQNLDAGVDAAVGEDAAVDAATPADDIASPRLDASRPADLTHPADLTSADLQTVCTPVTTGSTQTCTVSASCNGHTYEVECTGYSECTCYVDGVAGKSSGNLGGTCTSTTGLPGWGTYGCNFPG